MGGDEAGSVIGIATGALEDAKARDLLRIDIAGRASTVFDAFLICTATSDRHAAAMAERVRVALKRAGAPIRGIEGPGESGWTLIDADSVVIHIFLEEARRHYDLESLWDDLDRA